MMEKIIKLLKKAQKLEVQLSGIRGDISKEAIKYLSDKLIENIHCDYLPGDGFAIVADIGKGAPYTMTIPTFIGIAKENGEVTEVDFEQFSF